MPIGLGAHPIIIASEEWLKLKKPKLFSNLGASPGFEFNGISRAGILNNLDKEYLI